MGQIVESLICEVFAIVRSRMPDRDRPKICFEGLGLFLYKVQEKRDGATNTSIVVRPPVAAHDDTLSVRELGIALCESSALRESRLGSKVVGTAVIRLFEKIRLSLENCGEGMLAVQGLGSFNVKRATSLEGSTVGRHVTFRM